MAQQDQGSGILEKQVSFSSMKKNARCAVLPMLMNMMIHWGILAFRVLPKYLINQALHSHCSDDAMMSPDSKDKCTCASN